MKTFIIHFFLHLSFLAVISLNKYLAVYKWVYVRCLRYQKLTLAFSGEWQANPVMSWMLWRNKGNGLFCSSAENNQDF